ncbi:NAD(P)-binding domain-containing protein [Erythrobacter sp. SCSIO 43205]|uniref:pyrroline-5-carboxylate reductase family protein n=1 Tax=Erythrobacter sp. SCSIO 43205 TaxID=2779361 RepID=UPI001CA9A5C4|nr:pyrroline-5-carboxylate reductase dimerization domain-containing protein [Erythrobacter sp. SCSIO 43205]UAB79169.1 NAD(P)-binding domain-containing protein [Erythrobacter sp. SCSIO 43205]
MKHLLIIGCGNMGGAMLAGWLAAGVEPSRFSILDPGMESAPDGVALYREASEAEAAALHDTVMLGFKPQQLGALAPGLQALTGEGVTLASLLAGITIAQLKATFPASDAHIRVMPNLAARINKSPIILLEDGLTAGAREDIFAFFDHLGMATWLEDEAKFDLVTALAGSGPGFVYRFIDALAEAAQELGIDKEQATALAIATVDGASSLAAGADVSPATLADRVASPGGMTREGMNVLDADKALVKLLTKTLKETAERGAALSAGAG